MAVRKKSAVRKKPAKASKPAKKAKLLAGDNPQIAKGEGNAPVQAYIKAVPGWKRALARRLDALISEALPGVKKAGGVLPGRSPGSGAAWPVQG